MAAASRRRSKGRLAPGGGDGDGGGGAPRAGPLVLGVAGAVEAGRGGAGGWRPEEPPCGQPRRGGRGQAGWCLKMEKIKKKEKRGEGAEPRRGGAAAWGAGREVRGVLECGAER